MTLFTWILLWIFFIQCQVIGLAILFLAILQKLTELCEVKKRNANRKEFLIIDSFGNMVKVADDLRPSHEKPESVEHGSPFKK